MKKIEKDILFQDLKNVDIQFNLKIKKLDTIIQCFMEYNENLFEPIKQNNSDFDDNISVFNNDSLNDNENDDSENKNYIDENENINDDVKNDIINDSNKENINLSDDIKLLYRKIMIKTHPDKNNGIQNEYLQNLYIRTIKAKDNNDKAEIMFIAYELNISELYDIDIDNFGSIKKKIAEYQNNLNSLNNNPFWIWYHTDNENLKRVMVDQISKLKK